MTILVRATPGHTAGALSYFFDVTDGTRLFRAGLHGGAGVKSLSKEYLEAHRLPFSLRDDYIRSMERLKEEKVDIFLGNHTSQDRTQEKTAYLKAGSADAFIDSTEWCRFLDGCVQKLMKQIRIERNMKSY